MTFGVGHRALSSEWRSEFQAKALLLAAAGSNEATVPAVAPAARIVRRLPLKTGATSVAWSPDGKLLAALGGLKQHLTVWNALTGKVVWEAANEFGGDGTALAFSADGRLLLAPAVKTSAANQNTALVLWDVGQGTIAGQIAGPSPSGGWAENFARRMTIDRGHDLMAVVTSGLGAPVGIYDMRDWGLVGAIFLPKEQPVAAAFGPDGTLAIGFIGRTICLFDPRTRLLKRKIDVPAGIDSLAYSPDGKYIASGHGGRSAAAIRIWSATDGALVRSYPGGLSVVSGLAWSPDGRLIASAAFDRTVRLWPAHDAGAGQVIATFYEAAWAVAFSPDGRFVAAAGNEGVIVAEIY